MQQVNGASAGACQAYHLEVLQPLRVDLQATPVRIQGEQVNIADALLLFLQQWASSQTGCM